VAVKEGAVVEKADRDVVLEHEVARHLSAYHATERAARIRVSRAPVLAHGRRYT
jgi:hypothetical protein